MIRDNYRKQRVKEREKGITYEGVNSFEMKNKNYEENSEEINQCQKLECWLMLNANRLNLAWVFHI